jgi:exopolysaccharide biosynthesis protein
MDLNYKGYRLNNYYLILALFLSFPSKAAEWKVIRPGLLYSTWSIESPPQVYHAIRSQLDQGDISIHLSLEADRGKTPTAFARMMGADALINGSFFNNSFFSLGPSISENVVWSSTYDKSEATGMFACTKGNSCSIYHYLPARMNPLWNTGLSGIHSLIIDGQVRTSTDDAKCRDLCLKSHPRTAVGLSSNNRIVYFVIAEGRRNDSLGVSLSTLAAEMKKFDIANALNLDGGGSTGMVINGQLINNRPLNEPLERRVSNAIGFSSNEAIRGQLP